MLEAPKGVEVNAGVGEFRASCRKELTLESSEGEVSNLLVLVDRSHRIHLLLIRWRVSTIRCCEFKLFYVV